MKVLPLLLALLPAMAVLVASGCEKSTPTPGAVAAGKWVLYVINADGSGLTRLAENAGSNFVFPSWSPDGSRIAFQSNRDGNHEVYIMNADGTGETNLTNDLAEDGEPDWSPVQTR